MINLRKICCFFAVATAFALAAQQSEPDSVLSIVNAINCSANIRVEQPEALARLVERHVSVLPLSESDEESNVVIDRPAATRAGYRVQVFDDNNPHTARSSAQARQRQFEAAFPQWKAYVSFNSPYWQVRVGDFRSRGEAEAAVAEIRAAFPAYAAYVRIVRDKINILD